MSLYLGDDDDDDRGMGDDGDDRDAGDGGDEGSLERWVCKIGWVVCTRSSVVICRDFVGFCERPMAEGSVNDHVWA